MTQLGPTYNVPLLESLPLGFGGMIQKLPSRQDLEDVRTMSQRTAAGYEVLLKHYHKNQNTLEKVFGFANKMSRSGSADRARAGNDMLELLAQMEFKATNNGEESEEGEESEASPFL